MKKITNIINTRLFLILLALIVFIVGNFVMTTTLSSYRYIRYLTPLMLIVFSLFIKKRYRNFDIANFEGKVLNLYIVVIIYTLLTSLTIWSPGYTYRSLSNSVFILSPLATVIMINRLTVYKQRLFIINFLFWSFALASLLNVYSNLGSFKSLFSFNLSQAVSGEEFETESIDGLFFSFFSLFFLYKKKYKEFLIALLLVFVAAKRVALGAFFVGLIAYVLYDNLSLIRNRKYLSTTLFIIASFFLVEFWILLYSGSFEDVIFNLTGFGTDAFFMGRQQIISEFFLKKPDSDPIHFGYGVGYVENILIKGEAKQLLFHNDFLKLYLEFGIIGFFVFLSIFYNNAIKNKLSFSCFIILLVLMQTDNPLTYDKVMVPFYMIFTLGLSENRTPTKNSNLVNNLTTFTDKNKPYIIS